MCECVCVLYLVNALTKDKESIESKFEITLKGEKWTHHGDCTYQFSRERYID